MVISALRTTAKKITYIGLMKLTANLRWQARAVTVSCYYCVLLHMITSHSKVLVPTGAHRV